MVRANVQAAFENIALWHERDISHSSVERVILPDSTILADYLLDRTTRLVDQLLVYPERMRRNLDMTRGLVFSGQLLLDLAAAGMLREDAYRVVQTHAMQAWEEEGDFRAAVEADPEIRTALTPEQIAEAFSLDRQLRNVEQHLPAGVRRKRLLTAWLLRQRPPYQFRQHGNEARRIVQAGHEPEIGDAQPVGLRLVLDGDFVQRLHVVRDERHRYYQHVAAPFGGQPRDGFVHRWGEPPGRAHFALVAEVAPAGPGAARPH